MDRWATRETTTHHVDCVGLRSVPMISAKGYWSPVSFRSLFGHDALNQIGMDFRRRDQPISMAQMPVPVAISKILMGLLSSSGAKCSLSCIMIFIIWCIKSSRSNSFYQPVRLMASWPASFTRGSHRRWANNKLDGGMSIRSVNPFSTFMYIHSSLWLQMQID